MLKLDKGVRLFANYAQGFKAPAPSQVNQFFENPIGGYRTVPNPDTGSAGAERLMTLADELAEGRVKQADAVSRARTVIAEVTGG